VTVRAAPPSHDRRLTLALLVAGAGLAWLALRSVHSPPIKDLRAPDARDPVAANAGAASPVAGAKPTSAPRAEEPWHEPVDRAGLDASNIYKDAFVLFDRLSEEEKTMIRKPREEVDAEKAAALFEKIRAIMDLLRAAAKADYCDWGMAPYTFDTPMPHITKAADLGKVALWAAAYQFSTDPAAALDALTARAQLGHHLADTLIGLLVETSFEKSAHDLLRQHVGSFDAAVMAKAGDLVSASAIDADITRAFEAEAASVEATGRQLAAKSAEERAQILSAIDTAPPGSVERAASEMATIFGDPARLAAEVAFIRKTDDAMRDAMQLPEAQFQSWWKGVESELANGHPLAQMTLPALASVQRKMQQMRVERTLLGAGLDVLQNGPAQLARYRDPATGNALVYVPTPGGFDLRSTYEVKGKPITCSFPVPK
jgi:hypothetical protein